MNPIKRPLPTLPRVVLSLAMAFLCLAPAGTRAQGDDPVESLKFKLAAERQSLQGPSEDLKAKYQKALERLREEATAQGNLDGRLAVDEEIKYLAGEAEERPDPGKYDQLASMRKIYDERKTVLIKEADTRREKLLREYAAAFTDLQKSLTIESRIEEAVKARDMAGALEAELERLRKAAVGATSAPEGDSQKEREISWTAPFAGEIAESSSTGVLFTGAAEAGLFGAVVVKERLPNRFTARGQVKIEGSFPGIVVGFDSENDPFAYLYPDVTGIQIETWHQRQRLKTSRLDHEWERGSWISFEVTRTSREWTVKLGSKKLPIPLPGDIRGSRFGFMTFGPGVVNVRRLAVTAD